MNGKSALACNGCFMGCITLFMLLLKQLTFNQPHILMGIIRMQINYNRQTKAAS